MFGTWNVQNVECQGFGLLGMWNVWDVRYPGPGMFGMWDARCLLGYGILVYKIIFIPADIHKSFDHWQEVRQESMMMLKRLLTKFSALYLLSIKMKCLANFSKFCGLSKTDLEIWCYCRSAWRFFTQFFTVFNILNDLHIGHSLNINFSFDKSSLFTADNCSNGLARELNWDLCKLVSGHFSSKTDLMQMLINRLNRLSLFAVLRLLLFLRKTCCLCPGKSYKFWEKTKYDVERSFIIKLEHSFQRFSSIFVSFMATYFIVSFKIMLGNNKLSQELGLKSFE